MKYGVKPHIKRSQYARKYIGKYPAGQKSRIGGITQRYIKSSDISSSWLCPLRTGGYCRWIKAKVSTVAFRNKIHQPYAFLRSCGLYDIWRIAPCIGQGPCNFLPTVSYKSCSH